MIFVNRHYKQLLIFSKNLNPIHNWQRTRALARGNLPDRFNNSCSDQRQHDFMVTRKVEALRPGSIIQHQSFNLFDHISGVLAQIMGFLELFQRVFKLIPFEI